jgi:ankyrin repeat protein
MNPSTPGAASHSLPDRPHLDHLRRQARDLLRAWRAGDAAALARAAPCALGPAVGSEPRLASAQLVIAREYGLASWPKLVEEVERRNAAHLSDADFVKRVLPLIYGQGWDMPQPQRALALLRSRRVNSLPLALATGQLPEVQRALAGTDLAAPLPPLAATPLAAAAFSSLARIDELRPGLVATVRWLLAQGADANTRWADDPARPDEALPVLYGAVSRAACFETVQALLQAGADPNDNESLYHATELTDRRIIAALVQAGARWQGSNALLRQLDHDRLDDLRQVLDLGADVREHDADGGTALHHAIIRGRSVAFVRLLVERGADPAAVDGQGHTPAAIAARAGDVDTVAYLASLGHTAPGGERERFLAACAAADVPAAQAHLSVHPHTISQLSAQELRLLPDQAQRGRIASVRLMLELGWPVAVQGDWQASALNQAAFRGDAAMVQLLLEHGARWHEKNGFGGDALGSCLHAARNQPEAGGDYAAVLLLLLADGAPVPAEVDDLPDELQAVLAAGP